MLVEFGAGPPGLPPFTQYVLQKFWEVNEAIQKFCLLLNCIPWRKNIRKGTQLYTFKAKLESIKCANFFFFLNRKICFYFKKSPVIFMKFMYMHVYGHVPE